MSAIGKYLQCPVVAGRGQQPVASASALPDPFRPFKPHAVDDRLGRLAVSWRLRGVSDSDPTEADVQDNDQNLRKKCFMLLKNFYTRAEKYS